MSKKEIRSFDSIEARAEGDSRQLVGVATPWDTLSVDLGGFLEKFERGAFGELDGEDIVATVEHDNRLIIGRTPGTLNLRDTDKGLEYTITLADTTAAEDVWNNVKSGNLRGSSFEFIVGDFRREETDSGTPIRVVTDATLFQVGPVANPAYREGTDVALRSLDATREQTEPETDPEAERRLRSARTSLTL